MLSVLVEAMLPLPAASLAPLALTEAITVPSEAMPLTATLYVVPEPVTRAVVAPAVPPRVTSAPVKPLTSHPVGSGHGSHTGTRDCRTSTCRPSGVGSRAGASG